jgi:hypothetical protein
MRATSSDPAAIVRLLVAAVPEDRLRSLLVALVLDDLMPSMSITEPRRRRGRPPGAAAAANGRRRKAANGRRRAAKPDDPKLLARRQRYAARRAAARRAAKAGSNGEDAVSVSPEALWRHAEKLEPTRPWAAVAREFGVKEAAAQQAHRSRGLPPGIGPMAITRFLTVQPG